MTPETAFVFPGGGSQVSNPLEEFHGVWPEVASSIDRLNDDEVRRLLFEADEETLGDPLNMHRVVMASGFVVADAVTERFGVEPDVVAGHSTGHLTALPVAGVLSPADALEFVTGRSRAMKSSAEARGPGKMVAVLLVDSGTVTDVVSGVEGVSIAAYNSPGETVISGRAEAVDVACDRLRVEHDPVRTTELDVELAAHSSVVAGAVEWAERALESAELADPTVPVVSDVTGECYETSAVARRDLPRQIVSPVRWRSIVETIDAMGVERVVEFPPASVLTDFVSRMELDVTVIALTDPDTARGLFHDT